METVIEQNTSIYDFNITNSEEFIKLKALNKDAIDWIRIVILKPCGIITPQELNTVMLKPDILEEILRSIMAEGYKVNFKQE